MSEHVSSDDELVVEPPYQRTSHNKRTSMQLMERSGSSYLVGNRLTTRALKKAKHSIGESDNSQIQHAEGKEDKDKQHSYSYFSTRKKYIVQGYYRNSSVGTIKDCVSFRLQALFEGYPDPWMANIISDRKIDVNRITLKGIAFFMSRSMSDWCAFSIWCREVFGTHNEIPIPLQNTFEQIFCYHFAYILQQELEDEVELYHINQVKDAGKKCTVYQWIKISSSIDWNSYDRVSGKIMGYFFSELSFRSFNTFSTGSNNLAIKGQDFEEQF